jgi:energy-coupling factor transport system permease protein
LVCLLINIVILLIGRVLKRLIPFLGVNIFVLISVVIIQGLVMPGNRTLLFQIGPFHFYQEGLDYATILCLRVLNVLCAFAVLVLTTKPSDLIESLVERGLTPKLGYILSAVLQIVPQLMAAMEKIIDSQRSRGMETEGSLRVRIKAYLPLLMPVVLSSLTNIKEQAMALEVRGFNSPIKKSFLNKQSCPFGESCLQMGLLLLIILTFMGRFIPWGN